MSNPPGGGRPFDDPGERIDSYLDELLLALRGRPREARRLLAEVESHLRESIEAHVAAGLDELEATEETLRRFGPPSVVARGLPPQPAYRSLLSQMAEAALLVVSLLFLAAGAAAVPAALLGLTADPGVVTGDRAGQVPAPGRCQQLLHMLAAPSCPQALAAHHLQEVVRDHLLSGWLGFLVLVAWWVLHSHRRARPTVLPAGFAVMMCVHSGRGSSMKNTWLLAPGTPKGAWPFTLAGESRYVPLAWLYPAGSLACVRYCRTKKRVMPGLPEKAVPETVVILPGMIISPVRLLSAKV